MAAKKEIETRMFINGEYHATSNSVEWKNIDPATEEVICVIKEASKEDVNLAVNAAVSAFTSWHVATTAKRRGELLYKLAEVMENNAEEICQLESLDVGKPITDCRNSDIPRAISILRYYGGWADKIEGNIVPMDLTDLVCQTRYEAVGVVGMIVAWNYPIMLCMTKLGPALACGCTVVIKPSEKASLTTLALGKYINEAGIPPGVVNILAGYGPTVGNWIVEHPKINKITFTGSSVVGKQVGVKCASLVKRITLELGGKSSVIICADADIEKAAISVWHGIFGNSGQCCVACSRVMIHESIYTSFIDAIKKYNNKAANLSHPSDDKCTMGPLVDEIQYKKVLAYIKKGISEAASCAIGGEAEDRMGYWIKPTIFSDVKDEMCIAKEEIFGPVVCLLKFSNIDEAIRRSNDTPYGLGAGVFTSSMEHAEYCVSRLHAGTVWINTYLESGIAAPFGGYKESGIGRELGKAGLFPYLELKTVLQRLHPIKP